MTVNVHVHDTKIKMSRKGERLTLRVTDHYNITFHVTCSPSATVRDILMNICSRGGYDSKDINITYLGKKLSLQSRISDHNIHENDELKIIISMKGGTGGRYKALFTVDVDKGITTERKWSKNA